MYSDTSVTGVVSYVTVHWPGLACRPDFLKSTGSSGRSLGHCYSSQIDVTGIPCSLMIRFGTFLLEPAGVATLLLMLDYVDSAADRIVAKMFLLQQIVDRGGDAVAVYMSLYHCIVAEGAGC